MICAEKRRWLSKAHYGAARYLARRYATTEEQRTINGEAEEDRYRGARGGGFDASRSREREQKQARISDPNL